MKNLNASSSKVKNTNKMLQEAIQKRSNNDFDGAIFIYQELIELQPENATLYDRLAQTQAKKGNLTEAVNNYKKAIELGIKNAVWTHKNLGDALREDSKLDEAESIYLKAVNIDPHNPFIYDGLGQTQSQQRKFAEAVVNYKKALDLDIDNPIWTYKNLEAALRAENRLEEAEAVYKESLTVELRKTENSFDVDQTASNKWLELHNQGDSYFQQQEWEKAIVSYQQAIELNPNYFWSYYNLGRALSELEKWDEVISALKISLEVDTTKFSLVSEKIEEAISIQNNKLIESQSEFNVPKKSKTDNYVIITPFWIGDKTHVEAQHVWLSTLGHKFENHIYLFRGTRELCGPSILPNLRYLDTELLYPEFSLLPHPAGPNICFYHAAQWAMKNNYDYMFWLEPDCIPTQESWLEPFIELATKNPEEPIIGIPGGKGWSSQWHNHFAGNSFYNLNKLSELNWENFLENALDKSFDIWLSLELGYISLKEKAIDDSSAPNIIWGKDRYEYEVNFKPDCWATCGYDHWRPQKFQGIEKTFAQCLSKDYKIYHSIKDPNIYHELKKTVHCKFSIIVFNYNYGSYLEECLDSLLIQNYEPSKYEVILMDDGSNDCSMEIAKQYEQLFREKGIKYIVDSVEHGKNCPNFNQQRLLKSALKYISGSHICLLDSDDLFMPNKLAELDKHFSPATVLVQHAAEKVDENKKRLGELNNFKGKNYVNEDLYYSENRNNFFQPTSFLAFQYSYFQQALIFLKQDKFTNTWLDVRLSRFAPFFGRVISTYGTLGKYRIHNQNDSSSKSNFCQRIHEHHKWFNSVCTNKSALKTELKKIPFQANTFSNSLIAKESNPIQSLVLDRFKLPVFSSIDRPIVDFEPWNRNFMIKQQVAVLASGEDFENFDNLLIPNIADLPQLLCSKVYQSSFDNQKLNTNNKFKIDMIYVSKFIEMDLLIRMRKIQSLIRHSHNIIPVGFALQLLKSMSLENYTSFFPKDRTHYIAEEHDIRTLCAKMLINARICNLDNK